MRINDELTIDIPDGFHVMSDEELANFHFYDKPNWTISDPERHIIMTVSWKKSGLAAMLLKTKDVINKMEPQMQKLMEPYGYSFQNYLKEDVGGLPADGFLFTYKAQDIGMCGESFSVKKGKTFYYFHCYMREELMEESRPVVEELMRSASWSA